MSGLVGFRELLKKNPGIPVGGLIGFFGGIVFVAVAALWAKGLTAPAVSATISFFAFCAALYVPFRINLNATERDDAEKKLKAQCLAQLLLPEIVELEEKLRPTKTHATLLQNMTAGQTITEEVAFGRLALALPPVLAAADLEFAILKGEAAQSSIQLATTAQQFNRMVEKAKSDHSHYVTALQGQVHFNKIGKAATTHLQVIEELANKTRALLAPIHDGK